MFKRFSINYLFLKNVKLNYNICNKIAYILILVLLTAIIIYCINFKYTLLNRANSNYMREGFTTTSDPKTKVNKKEEDISVLMERKLNGIMEELGGKTGKGEVKQVLLNTKKICDLESSKCMMNLIEDNKGIKSIDLEQLLDDDDNVNCIKCKKYTELSNSIKNMIDNL
jgi:hypothetical protein